MNSAALEKENWQLRQRVRTLERALEAARQPRRRSAPRVQPRSALDLVDQLEHTHGLETRQATGYGATRFMACCPAHEDRYESLSITELNDGKILLNCFAGCETEDVLRAIGWEWGHLMGGDSASTSQAREAQYRRGAA